MTASSTTKPDLPRPTRQQRHGLLEQAMRHAAIGMALVRPDGSFLEVNAALCRLLGRDAESLLQMRLADVTHPGDLAESFRLFEELVRGERECVRLHQRYIHADGHLIWGQVTVSGGCDGSGDLVVVQIAEISTISEELAASEEHFRLLAENVSDVVFRLAEDGRIVWVSPSLTPTLGWTPEDWIGQVGTIFLVHGGNAEHYQANLEALKEGVVPPLAREQVYAKDGSKHWVETHASPYRDANGEVKGIVASFRVIDSVVAAEAELRLSEERYRLLAENARDVIWTMEPDGRISYVSPSIQLLRGFTPEEAMQQRLDEIHPPESMALSQA